MVDAVFKEIFTFLRALALYLKQKGLQVAILFESNKKSIVTKLLWRRGALYRPFVHAGMVLLTITVMFIGGAFSGTSLVSGTFSSVTDERVLGAVSTESSVALSPLDSTTTYISEKPRDTILEYTVEGGDTLSSIAQKWGIDVPTVKWANDLSDVDSIKPGQKLKILPVSGVSHTVAKGDTIYSVAKKYDVDSQAVLNFPFNTVGDDLSIVVGDVLIVPGGEPPRPAAPPRPQYFARAGQGAGVAVAGGGSFVWPAGGQITSFFAGWHPGIDVANSVAPGIAAADGGRVIIAGWPDRGGYGSRITIDHGNGFTTLYAHLSRLYVSVGDYVKKGDIIGQMGSTGRSTGTHLHFEVHKNGAPLNPLNLLK